MIHGVPPFVTVGFLDFFSVQNQDFSNAGKNSIAYLTPEHQDLFDVRWTSHRNPIKGVSVWSQTDPDRSNRDALLL
jgi:hypothetical protein